MKRYCKGCARIDECRRSGIDVDAPCQKDENLGCYTTERKRNKGLDKYGNPYDINGLSN